MTAEIITAISRRLQEGDSARMVVTDTVEQGLDTPCFFIAVLEPIQVPLVGQRWRRDMLFDIQYLDFAAKNPQLYAVAEELFEALEYITLPNGDLLRGTAMRFDIQDGVLHFFVTYRIFLYRKEEQERMAILTLREGLQEE